MEGVPHVRTMVLGTEYPICYVGATVNQFGELLACLGSLAALDPLWFV